MKYAEVVKPGMQFAKQESGRWFCTSKDAIVTMSEDGWLYTDTVTEFTWPEGEEPTMHWSVSLCRVPPEITSDETIGNVMVLNQLLASLVVVLVAKGVVTPDEVSAALIPTARRMEQNPMPGWDFDAFKRFTEKYCG